MSNYIQEMKAKAAAQKKTIVLPESNDKRTYTAVEQIMKERISNESAGYNTNEIQIVQSDGKTRSISYNTNLENSGFSARDPIYSVTT